MAHLCRRFFPTILEQPGLMYYILSSSFAKSKSLYGDITNEHKEYLFKEYLYHFFDSKAEKEEQVGKSVRELLDAAGYELFECKSNEDVQRFRKYYAEGEELCTFKNPHRIDNYHIFFIVKKDVDKLKRENFTKPNREDEYSTSVLDLQFDRGNNQRVSIKSRYNHTVRNPDATYENNLNNIASGLTAAFENEYGFNIGKASVLGFRLEDYEESRDGKFYKYNYEINNIHYCVDNIILNNGQVVDTYKDKSRYTFMDYFILDEKEKKIIIYDDRIDDSFVNDLKNIVSIQITKKDTYKEVRLTLENNKEVIIKLDKRGRIIGYINENLKKCGSNFLSYNTTLQEVYLPELEECEFGFLNANKCMKELFLPKLRKCKSSFMGKNDSLLKLYLPELEECDDNFLIHNQNIQILNLPKLKKCGDGFLRYNISLTKVLLPLLEECGNGFLYASYCKELSLPKLKKCKNEFLGCNESLSKLDLPSLEECGSDFLNMNKCITELNLPKLEKCKDYFMTNNNCINAIYMPRLKKCGEAFLSDNDSLIKLDLPELEECGDMFFKLNKSVKELNLPKLRITGREFFHTIIDGSLLINYFTKEKIGFTYANVPLLEDTGLYKSIMKNVDKTIKKMAYVDDETERLVKE